MASRTDQLHSYQFRTRRVLAALVMRETDPAQSPLRRGVGAVFAGIMLSVLVSAGLGIYAIFTRVGGDAWRTDGSVVVERETGATYVYLNGTLYPTLNLASAMLAARQPNPTVHRVASRSLTDVARGNPIGIPAAPDSLPPANRQIGLPWTVCARNELDSSGRSVPRVDLAVGVAATGGRPLEENALLVRAATGEQTYVVFNGRRYLVQSASTLVPALFGAQQPIVVGTAWLNALPAGADIAPIRVSSRGQQSNAMPEFDNGDVLRAETGSGTVYYLVLNDGYAPLTELQVDILGAGSPIEPIDVNPTVIANVPRSSALPERREIDPPAVTPRLASPGASELICATTNDDAQPPSIAVGATVEGLDRATPTPGVADDGVPLADRVLVPAGRVSVVRTVAAPGSPAGTYLVVTDIGVGYPVPDASVLPLLGYAAEQAVDVPTALASLVPAGPVLDPAAATAPAALS